jgi:hypothetical protein
MRFMKTTAVALTLALGGLSAPISSPLTATDAAADRVVTKRVVKRPNGTRVVTKRVVVRRPGVRVVDNRYWYGGRYYDYNQALAAGLIGFTAGAIVGGALAAPAPYYVAPAPYYVIPY